MRLEDFLFPTQKKLFSKLRKMYRDQSIVKAGSYILVKGEAPVMLLAHMDTVHHDPVREICKTRNGNILMSPQGIGGDDRCGIFALVTLYRQAKVKPWLLFTCDEEIGGIGASVFAKDYRAGELPKELADLKYLIEIDRKGSNDAVFYDCWNDEFEAFIEGYGFKSDWGSFSDISIVAPELGVAAVNLSSGYYNAHTQHEYIVRSELNETIRRVGLIVADSLKDSIPKYEYKELVRKSLTDIYPDLGMYGHRYSLTGWPDDKKKDFKSYQTQEMYDRLLMYYSPVELDQIIEENGEIGIRLMYENEFDPICDPYTTDPFEDDEIWTEGGFRACL